MLGNQRDHKCLSPHSILKQKSLRKCASLHATPSAFCALAKADEDWTQISELGLRRKIQNRIAQRNYRKKLQRRKKDLEQEMSLALLLPEPSRTKLTQSSTVERKKRSSPMAEPMALKVPQGSSTFCVGQYESPELYAGESKSITTSTPCLYDFTLVECLLMYSFEPYSLWDGIPLTTFSSPGFTLSNPVQPDLVQLTSPTF